MWESLNILNSKPGAWNLHFLNLIDNSDDKLGNQSYFFSITQLFPYIQVFDCIACGFSSKNTYTNLARSVVETVTYSPKNSALGKSVVCYYSVWLVSKSKPNQSVAVCNFWHMF